MVRVVDRADQSDKFALNYTEVTAVLATLP